MPRVLYINASEDRCSHHGRNICTTQHTVTYMQSNSHYLLTFSSSLVVHSLVQLKDLFPLLDQEGSENTACNENARRDSISNPRKKNNNPLHGRVKY